MGELAYPGMVERQYPTIAPVLTEYQTDVIREHLDKALEGLRWRSLNTLLRYEEIAARDDRYTDSAVFTADAIERHLAEKAKTLQEAIDVAHKAKEISTVLSFLTEQWTHYARTPESVSDAWTRKSEAFEKAAMWDERKARKARKKAAQEEGDVDEAEAIVCI